MRGVGITIRDSLGEPVFSVGTTSQMDYTTTVPLEPGDYTMNVSAIGYASGNVGPVYDETSTFTVQ